MMESQEGKPGTLLLPAAAQRPTTDTPGASVPAVQLCTPLPRASRYLEQLGAPRATRWEPYDRREARSSRGSTP